MAEPIIYTRNYIDKETVFVVSNTNMRVNIDKIFDTDKDNFAITSGANSDGTLLTIEAHFKDGSGADVSRTVDTVIIVKHNLKDIEIERWNGSTWVSVATETNLTTGTIIISFSSVSTQRIRLSVSPTQTANQEKQIGLMFACAVTSDIGVEITNLSVSYRQKQSILLMGDGQLQRTVVSYTPNRSAKYQAKASFRLLSDATFEILRAVKEDGLAFLWQPESETKPEDIFLVHWTGPLQWSYTSKYKGAGKSMILDLKEV